MGGITFSDILIWGLLLAGAVAGAMYNVWALAILCGGLLAAILVSYLFMKVVNTDKIIQMNVKSGEDDKKYVKKYKQADIGRFASVFMLLGLVISLSTTIFAFNWSQEEAEVMDLGELVIEDDVECLDCDTDMEVETDQEVQADKIETEEINTQASKSEESINEESNTQESNSKKSDVDYKINEEDGVRIDD